MIGFDTSRERQPTSHDAVGVWSHLEICFQEQLATMPEHCGTSGCRGLLQHVKNDAGRTTTLATSGKLDIALDLGANSRGLIFK